jgi:hypothetical protein
MTRNDDLLLDLVVLMILQEIVEEKKAGAVI